MTTVIAALIPELDAASTDLADSAKHLLIADNPTTQIARENLESAQAEARRSQRGRQPGRRPCRRGRSAGPCLSAPGRDQPRGRVPQGAATDLFAQAALLARASGAAPESVIDLEIFAAEVLARRQVYRRENLELAIALLTRLLYQTYRYAPPASRAALLQSL